MPKLKLTPFGKFVNLHSVYTSIGWWRGVYQDIERLGDEGVEWEEMIDERIRGLQELKERYYEFANTPSQDWHVETD